MKDIKLVDKINARVPKAPGGDEMHCITKDESVIAWEQIVDMVNYASRIRDEFGIGNRFEAKVYETRYMEARDNVVRLLFGEGMRVVEGKAHDQLWSDKTALEVIEQSLRRRIDDLTDENEAYANQIMELTGFGDSLS